MRTKLGASAGKNSRVSLGKKRPGKSVLGSDELMDIHKPSMLCVETCTDRGQIRELLEMRLKMKAAIKL